MDVRSNQANAGCVERGNDGRRVGTGTRTETGTGRALLPGIVSLHAFALDVGVYEPATLGASESEGLVPT